VLHKPIRGPRIGAGTVYVHGTRVVQIVEAKAGQAKLV
jgi:hypothetical protein